MSAARKSDAGLDAKGRYGRLLALCMITMVLLTSVMASGIQASPFASAKPSSNLGSAGNLPIDPTAYIDGNHLYDLRNWNIPVTGENFTLDIPAGWNMTQLGLNFFNGTLQKAFYSNETIVTTQVTSQVGADYVAYISNLKVPRNATVYQAVFSITGVSMNDNNLWLFANYKSNSSYPVIDGNIGAGQRFLVSHYAESLSFQVLLAKFDGTVGNLTAEVWTSASDGSIGEFVTSVLMPSANVSLGSTWVTFSLPHCNITAGYYFMVLHSAGWLSTGGGYIAATTLTRQLSTPQAGWVTSNRGVNWENQLIIAGSSFYFGGFCLRVHIKATASRLTDINLRINDIAVGDNFIWNQSVWSAAYPYSVKIASSYPLTQLNFTYKVWYYIYGYNNPFRSGYHVTVNTNRTITASSSGNFTFMRIVLEESYLLAQGMVNITSNTVKLNLKLYNGTNVLIAGSMNVTAWAELTRKVDGLVFTGSDSLVLNFIYHHPEGSDNNVTLSEGAVTIGVINSQIDSIYSNNETVPRSGWIYSQALSTLGIFRDAFASLPEFTLLSGSKLNCTVTVFNNFTASTAITDYIPGTTPSATIRVQNTTPMIDLDGLTWVNITVTNPSGLVINNTRLPLGGPYSFNLTVVGEGTYGIRFISNDTIGHVATRWIGGVSVNDIILSTPEVLLNPATNLTSHQTLVILANVSYANHPEIPFNGNMSITISVAGSGATTHLLAVWNDTAKVYQASFVAPQVDSITQLSIQVHACDLKHRISTNFTSTYVVPSPGTTPPTIEPSVIGIVILGIVGVLVLVPTLAYLGERYRRR
jgi:hypothetical protein